MTKKCAITVARRAIGSKSAGHQEEAVMEEDQTKELEEVQDHRSNSLQRKAGDAEKAARTAKVEVDRSMISGLVKNQRPSKELRLAWSVKDYGFSPSVVQNKARVLDGSTQLASIMHVRKTSQQTMCR